MSDMTATVRETPGGFDVDGFEKIQYNFSFLDGVFDPKNAQLAEMYKKWGRVLAVADINVGNIYGARIEEYFKHHNIKLELFRIKIGEQAKTMATALSIVDKMIEFEVIRKEPVLVIGGGLTTDVGGFACAMFRRTTNFIRVPTTLIGLIDAAVSIKVGINHGKHKNKLGAYHAPIHTFLDFTFLRTLPKAQIRNGFAELIKISTCADLRTFDLLDQFCEKLIDTSFGRADGSDTEITKAADEINWRGIKVMLELESPNLHELMLDRVIAFGHTISPTLELTPDTPFRHGHAIAQDMSYFTTLAWKRGIINDSDHKRILTLFSRAGLTMDSEYLNEEVVLQGYQAILGVRDGLLRAATPAPLGQCQFINDVSREELVAAIHAHKEVCKGYPRQGAGLEAFVDASDTGVPEQDEGERMLLKKATEKAKVDDYMKGTTDGTNGVSNGVNGHSNGVNGHSNGVNGHSNGVNGHSNGVNGHSNGVNGHSNGVNGNGILDKISQALPSALTK